MVWFVAIPLLDCIGLIFARLKQGKSISSPGRDHIHHKLMIKYSPEGTLTAILVISLITGLIGIFLNNAFSPWVSTYLFIVYSACYYLYAYYYANIKIKSK